MTFRLLRLILLTALLTAIVKPAAAQSDEAAQILALINTLRTQSGLLPLDVNSQLTSAAQGHSDDMAATGNIDHTGSDGSSIDSRIRASGFGHWRSFGIWGENIYGGQLADVKAAWNFWINSQVHRANLLSPRYREIGIGVGHSANGTYYTLDFGAEPNVLPFFVTGSAPNVTLLLSNEDDITTGEGVVIMGQATQVRAAEGTDTGAASWQPWASTLAFKLSNAPGQHTITVEYKDDLGRGTKMSRTINTSELGANPTPTATPTETAVPATPTLTVTIEATAAPTVTSAQVLTTTAALTPTATTTATPTATPAPTDTPTAVPPTTTPQPSNTPAPQPTATATRPATATLTPIASPTPSATATTQVVVANLAAYPSASRLTPPAPRPAPPERPLFEETSSPVVQLFAIVIGLQVVALLGLGALVVIRMRRHM